MKAECPVCLNRVEVPSGAYRLECPHCRTVLEPIYQTTVTVTINLRDFILPLLPATVAGFFVNRSIKQIKEVVPRRAVRRGYEALVFREEELIPSGTRRTIALGAGGLTYLSSLAMLWIYKALQARYG